MKAYTAVLPDGEAISYVDRKRWLWTLSVVFPLLPFVGIYLHWTKGSELLLLLVVRSRRTVEPAKVRSLKTVTWAP